MSGHSEQVRVLALGTLDRRELLASGGWDQTVWVWDAASGEPLAELTGHQDTVDALAFGHIGDRPVLLSGAWDGRIYAWDPVTFERLEPALDGDRVFALALTREPPNFSRDIVLCGGWGKNVWILEAATGRTIGQLKGHEGAVAALALLPGGRAVSGGFDDAVWIWDLSESRPIGEPFETYSAILTVAHGHDLVVAGDSGGQVWRVDPDTGAGIGGPLVGHTGQVNAVVVGSGRIISGSDDGTVRTWSLDGTPLSTMDLHAPVGALALSPLTGRLHATAGPTLHTLPSLPSLPPDRAILAISTRLEIKPRGYCQDRGRVGQAGEGVRRGVG